MTREPIKLETRIPKETEVLYCAETNRIIFKSTDFWDGQISQIAITDEIILELAEKIKEQRKIQEKYAKDYPSEFRRRRNYGPLY